MQTDCCLFLYYYDYYAQTDCCLFLYYYDYYAQTDGRLSLNYYDYYAQTDGRLSLNYYDYYAQTDGRLSLNYYDLKTLLLNTNKIPIPVEITKSATLKMALKRIIFFFDGRRDKRANEKLYS